MVKLARCIGFGISGMALAQSAMAQETNVTTLAKSARLGGEFRSEYIYQDNGLQEISGADKEATSSIGVTAANVKLQGNINADTEYAFRFNLLNPATTGGPLDYGYGTHWFNKMIGFSFGKMRVLQGGFDNIDNSYRSHAVGVYADNLAFESYEAMAAFHVNVAGRVTLQVLNDKVVGGKSATGRASDAEWNKTVHPTWVLGWMGEFGPIKPLVDFGSYDNNKSRWIDVGVKAEMNGLLATLDYYNRNHVRRIEAGDKVEEKADQANAITVNVAYEIKDLLTPWFYFSTYENKQADDSKLGLKDTKINTVDANGNYVFDDNGMVYGVGVDFASFGRGWNPFVAYVARTGKFQDPKKAAGEEKSGTEMFVKVGVLGEI